MKTIEIQKEDRLVHGSLVKVIGGTFYGWKGGIIGFSGMNKEYVLVEIESPCGTYERGEWFSRDVLELLNDGCV